MIEDSTTEERTINPYLAFQGLFVQNYILQEEAYTDAEKLLFALVKPIIANGEVLPSSEVMAQRLGWKASKVQRTLRNLRQKELL